MSSEKKRKERIKRDASGARMTSIARSISWGYWWRRFIRWLLIDALVVGALIYAYAWYCSASIPEMSGWRDVVLWLTQGNALQKMASNLSSLALRYKSSSGGLYLFYLSEALPIFLPILVILGLAQLSDIVAVITETRRVRRKLQPLQELALTAEQIAHSATSDPMRGHDKISTLEAAIAQASVDSPTVTTGDQDLQSIEIALNSLLRQMQEAKLQQMRFVSDASHELRTPLAVLQGYVNMLSRWGKTDQKILDESIEAISLETDHMQELVEQLLFLARGDSGRNTLRQTTFNLCDVVHEVFEESEMIDNEHEYVCTVDETMRKNSAFEMTGDLAMVKQSLRIMVQNAERYSAKGSSIELGAAQNNTQVSYIVRDEGIGMNEKDASHIFERFYRSDDARSESGEGTGLGLSIAKWIVDAHKGTIEVVSYEGVGTRFTVSFPKAS